MRRVPGLVWCAPRLDAMRVALRVGLAVVVVALAFHGVAEVRAAGPSFSMTPTSGPMGTVISVDGRDWIGPPGVTEIVFLQFGSDEEINGVNGRPGSGALSAVATPDKAGTFHLEVHTGQYTGSCAAGGCLVCVADSYVLPACLGFILSGGPAPAPAPPPGAACPDTPGATLNLPASHTLAPGESADYAAGGFRVGSQVAVQLSGPAGGAPPVQATVGGSCEMQATITIPASGPVGTYTVTASGTTPSGGTRTWTTTFQVSGTAQAPIAPAVPEPTGDEMAAPTAGDLACGAAPGAFDAIRLRALASLHTLETLRAYHETLAQKEIDLSETLFKDAVVDFAAIAAGWPLGNAVQQALMKGASLTFGQELLKAGFKSVDTKLLKDPDAGNAFEYLTSVSWPDGALLPEGTAVDVTVEAAKQGLQHELERAMAKEAAEAVASTASGLLDFVKFGWAAYQGRSQQDALRGMKNRVFDKIVALDSQHAQDVFVEQRVKFALEICETRARSGLPADVPPDWADISSYLGLEG